MSRPPGLLEPGGGAGGGGEAAAAAAKGLGGKFRARSLPAAAEKRRGAAAEGEESRRRETLSGGSTVDGRRGCCGTHGTSGRGPDSKGDPEYNPGFKVFTSELAPKGSPRLLPARHDH